jgi:uncharacterized protein with HEPN domain
MLDQRSKRLRDALGACEAIEHFLGARSLAEYRADYGLRLQVERLLEIVGEALNRASELDESVSDALPQLRAVIGMRNRIIHGYDKIDDELIWLTAARRVPELRTQLEALLASE